MKLDSVQSAVPVSSIRPWSIRASDLWLWSEVGQSWVMDGIIPEKAIMLVVGPPKSGKSLLVQDLALSLTTGTPFLGVFEPPRTRRVLYIHEEEHLDQLYGRLSAIGLNHGAEPWGLPAELGVVASQGFSFDDREQMLRLQDEVAEFKPEVVIFDSLYTMHDRDEDNVTEMQPVLKALQRLRNRGNLTVIVVHHANKSGWGKTTPGNIRGTGAIWATGDGALLVSGSGKQKKVEIVLRHGGGREPFTFQPVSDTASAEQWGNREGGLLVGQPIIRFEVTGVGVTQRKAASPAAEENTSLNEGEWKVLRAVAALEKADIEALKERVHWNEKTVRTFANQLESRTLLEKDRLPQRGRRSVYSLSEEGRRLLYSDPTNVRGST